MKLRAVVLILVGSALAAVHSRKQCRGQQKCILMADCLGYKEYAEILYINWPSHMQKKVKELFCGWGKPETRQIFKICCNPKPETRKGELLFNGKSGRDLLDPEICGRSSAQRVAHGKRAEPFEYPWMALLGYTSGDFHCGGSLIAESFVLTAAHCNRYKQKKVFVRLGETDLSTQEDCIFSGDDKDCAEPYQDIPECSFIPHKRYSSSQKKHDIALVKLSKPAQLNDNVRPICLPLPGMKHKTPPKKMVVSGWGFTEDKNTTTSELRYTTLPIVAQGNCQQYFRRRHDVYTVDESQVCAGAGKDGADSCSGDSGGPLQYFGRTGYVIHGVVSWGVATCGEEKAPGVYTKVSHYLSWILDNLK